MRRLLIGLTVFAALLLAPLLPDAEEPAGHASIAEFFGTYEGRTLFPMGEQANRNLLVTIREHDADGFVVHWETTIAKGEDGAERKATALTFRPSDRPQIFEAVYPPEGTPNLMAGDSVAWALISGRTLTVHVITIVDGGSYVMQSYHRTLTDGGMKLEFVRLRDGVVERQLRGNLTRLETTSVPSE